MMTSSRRIIKSNYAMEDLEESIITTTYEIETEELQVNDSEQAPHVVDGNHKVLTEAKSEATQILATAEQEAIALKAQAEELGYTNGEKAGFEQGLQKGFNEGVAQAEIAFQEKETHLREMLESANTQLNAYKENVKEELLDLAIQIAEKIIHQQINESESGVLGIARPFFYQLDKDEELVILTTHPEALDKLNANLHKVEALVPESRVIALSNPNLEQNGLIVETSKGVVDFQVKQQLENMVKEFVETERTIDG